MIESWEQLWDRDQDTQLHEPVFEEQSVWCESRQETTPEKSRETNHTRSRWTLPGLCSRSPGCSPPRSWSAPGVHDDPGVVRVCPRLEDCCSSWGDSAEPGYDGEVEKCQGRRDTLSDADTPLCEHWSQSTGHCTLSTNQKSVLSSINQSEISIIMYQPIRDQY